MPRYPLAHTRLVAAAGLFAGFAVTVLTSAGAHAASPAVPLNPLPQAASYGNGSASYDTTSGGLVVHINLARARGGVVYRISACANNGGQLDCASDPNTDL